MPAKKKTTKIKKTTDKAIKAIEVEVKVENLEDSVISKPEDVAKLKVATVGVISKSKDPVNVEKSVPVSEEKVTTKLPDKPVPDNQKSPVIKPGLRPMGIKEIDEILGGGLPEKATVLLSGDAGVGKTTLAMQWLFNGYSQFKETGLYITLTEPTTVAINNLSSKTFFNKESLASCDVNASEVNSEIASREGVHFIDLRQLLEEMNLFKTEYTYKDVDKIHSVLFDMIMSAGVERVAIDSITAIAYLLGDKNLIRTFIYKMGKFLALANCNTLLIGEAKGDSLSVFGVEEFISDGVIKLLYEGDGSFPIRTLQIKKMRGIPFDSRKTPYKITNDGIQLFLRETKNLSHKASQERFPTGIHGFDRLIFGGLIAESAVLISGPSGGGKTLFSIQTMLNNLKNGKKCLYISHEESRGQILRNSKTFGWDLEKYEKENLLKIEAIHPDEFHLAELIFDTRKLINDFKPEVVVIDSLTAIANLYDEKKVHDWADQLISLFKKNKILSIFLAATDNLVGESVASNVGISSLFDSIIMIRFVEIDAEFNHAILVVKMRGSKHDKKMYKLVFGSKGLKVLGSYSGYEGIFSGSAKQISKSKEDKIHSVFMEVLGPMGEQFFLEQKDKGMVMQNIETMVEELYSANILNEDKKHLFLNKIAEVFEGAV